MIKDVNTANPVATERLYLNADRTKIVREGDSDARYLLAADGDEIPVEHHHLIEKQASKAANKAVKAHEDK